jgi:hypothetical protein
MTNAEFLNGFNLLYDSVTSNQAAGLNEYEISTFLTLAQNDIIKSYFNRISNKKMQGFDDSPKRQVDFSKLMKVTTLERIINHQSFNSNSKLYRMPDDLFVFINEQCKADKKPLVVKPISFDTYNDVMSKPFRYPPKNYAWRLLTDNDSVFSGHSVDYTQGWYNLDQAGSIQITNYSDKKVNFVIDYCGKALDYKIPCYLEKESETESEVKIVLWLNDEYRNDGFTSDIYDCLKAQTGELKEDIKRYLGYGDDVEVEGGFYIPDCLFDVFFEFMKYEAKNGTGDFSLSITADPCTFYTTKQSTIIELIALDDITKYEIRYVAKPKPIVLCDLDDNLSINGYTKETPCELDESLHDDILKRAVELASAYYKGDLGTQIQIGSASATDIGMLNTSKD